MSLNWDISKVANKDELYIESVENGETTYQLNDETDELIWMTMVIEMGEITALNWVEFYTRIRIYEALRGKITKSTVTPQLIHRHIGLRTNVFNDKRRWNAKVKMWQAELSKEY